DPPERPPRAAPPDVRPRPAGTAGTGPARAVPVADSGPQRGPDGDHHGHDPEGGDQEPAPEAAGGEGPRAPSRGRPRLPLRPPRRPPPPPELGASHPSVNR